MYAVWGCLGALIFVGSLFIAYLRVRGRMRLLTSLLQSFDRPMLCYDDRGRLVYCSPGLFLFDRGSKRAIERVPVVLGVEQRASGLIVIDSNRYRYLAKPLEYMPGRVGMLMLLEYLGSEKPGQT